MRKPIATFFTLFSIFLTGCVTQQQADIKMGKGCEAALSTLMKERQIVSVKSTNYSDEQTQDGLYRRITIDLVEKDGWAELDKTYSCLFSQDWGIFKSSHVALEQVVIDDVITGKRMERF